MVVDIYNPQHLEQLALVQDEPASFRRDTVRYATEVINEQLSRGDFFMCASSKQRDFWLGQLSGLGRVNADNYEDDPTLDKLLAVVPFGLPEEPPVRTCQAVKGVLAGIGETDELVLWGGGIYNWFDPLTLIRAIDQLRHRRPRVRLLFMGLRHPNPVVEESRMASEARALAGSLGLDGKYVFFNEDWVAYDDRQNFLLEAEVGVSTHMLHLETAFSFRTRILDYIWAGLPIVATTGDSFADLIASEQIGVTVPPGDVASLAEAINRLLDDRDFAATCRANLAHVRPRFVWDEVLTPLVEFCRSPRPARDRAWPEPTPPAAEPQPSVPSVRRNLEIAGEHFHAGGVRQVLTRARSRIGRTITGRS
jgi:glycosyltransferase involved in cell wall biosynthesis